MRRIILMALALGVVWVEAWVLHLIGHNDWRSFPSLMTAWCLVFGLVWGAGKDLLP